MTSCLPSFPLCKRTSPKGLKKTSFPRSVDLVLLFYLLLSTYCLSCTPPLGAQLKLEWPQAEVIWTCNFLFKLSFSSSSTQIQMPSGKSWPAADMSYLLSSRSAGCSAQPARGFPSSTNPGTQAAPACLHLCLPKEVQAAKQTHKPNPRYYPVSIRFFAISISIILFFHKYLAGIYCQPGKALQL